MHFVEGGIKRAHTLMYDSSGSEGNHLVGRGRRADDVRTDGWGAHAKTIELRNVMERRNEGERRTKPKIIQLVNSSISRRKKARACQPASLPATPENANVANLMSHDHAWGVSRQDRYMSSNWSELAGNRLSPTR